MPLQPLSNGQLVRLEKTDSDFPIWKSPRSMISGDRQQPALPKELQVRLTVRKWEWTEDIQTELGPAVRIAIDNDDCERILRKTPFSPGFSPLPELRPSDQKTAFWPNAEKDFTEDPL
jgi:hypothetical protein